MPRRHAVLFQNSLAFTVTDLSYLCLIFWGKIKTCTPITVSSEVSVLQIGSKSSMSDFVTGFWGFSSQMSCHQFSIGFFDSHILDISQKVAKLFCILVFTQQIFSTGISIPLEFHVETAKWTRYTWRWIALIMKQTMVLVSNIRTL